MDKKVFISDSQKDKAIADIICNSLEAEGINCWIAPRDIPYGNEWAGEITNAIKSSKVFLFLLSKNSNRSRQCPKEVNVADNTGIPIICIAIDNIEMNPALEYHLSNGQVMFIDAQKINEYENNIITSVNNKLNDSDNSDTRNYNFDTELERRFEELVVSDTDKGEKSEEDSFINILNKKISEHFFNRFEKNNKRENKELNAKAHLTDEDFDEFGDRIFSNEEIQNDNIITGLHFSITDDIGEITVVYQIITNYNISNFTYSISAVKLAFAQEELSEGKIKRTFFIECLEKETQLVIFTTKKSEQFVAVNSGIIDAIEGKVKISRQPSISHFETLESSDRIKEYECNKESGSIIILDPETGEEPPRRTYIDNSGIEKTVIDIKPGNCYIAFNVFYRDTKTSSNKMDAEDVGDYFMKGVRGFPKNTYNALIWYKKAKTPSAYRKMAEIFKKDLVFQDNDLAEKYYNLSLENRQTEDVED